jgi:hypothetical protein
MNILQRAWAAIRKSPLPNDNAASNSGTTEAGGRTTPEDRMKYLYTRMWVDPELRQTILDIRRMDKLDGRVKRIHSRLARDIIKGGLILQQTNPNSKIDAEWKAFRKRLQLHKKEKLKSDAVGLVKEGNLPIQWVLDNDNNVVAGVRMAAETIMPNVNQAGVFHDVRKAYIQYDVNTGAELASFPLWQLTLARFDPDNYDDMGALGRPYLDASRSNWNKLMMTEEDLVIRRRMRAPLRMSHVLEGASKEDVEAYRDGIEKDQAHGIITDYYSNKKGGVSPVQGDSNLDQMADIVHLIDTFFSGSPLPKGMMGYVDGLARDILEDLKRDYYDEVDVLQDTLSECYTQGFYLQLLLKGINPDDEDFIVSFAERRTETATQTIDIGLKMKALGYPRSMIFTRMGDDPAYVEKQAKREAAKYDPYGDDEEDDTTEGDPSVKITPGNGRKQESATSITNE